MRDLRETDVGALLGITDMLGVTGHQSSYRASESRAPVSFSYLPDAEFDRRFGKNDGWADPDTGCAYIRQSIRGSPYERVVKLHELYELMYPDAEHGQLHRWVLDFLKGTDPEAYKAAVADIDWKRRYGGPEGRRFAEDVLSGFPSYLIAPASYDSIRAGRGMPGDGDDKYKLDKFYEFSDYFEALPSYVLPTWFGEKGWISSLAYFKDDKNAYGRLYKFVNEQRQREGSSANERMKAKIKFDQEEAERQRQEQAARAKS